MKNSYLALPLTLGLGLAMTTQAHAVGCLSGGAVGAVGGHVMGHHAVLGAVGGCIAGHEMAKHEKEEAQRANDANNDNHGASGQY